MEEGAAGGGAGGGGESARPSSFRASVTGLVRRVSQKVTRENKGISRHNTLYHTLIIYWEKFELLKL